MTKPWTQTPTVAVVGGGLAGLAAACALADSGLQVTVFERRPYLGGRASSYQHPSTGEVVDNCQHVLLGCCTNLIEFYQRLGVEDKIRWFDSLTLLEPCRPWPLSLPKIRVRAFSPGCVVTGRRTAPLTVSGRQSWSAPSTKMWTVFLCPTRHRW